MRILGIVLLVAGLAILVERGFSYTKRERAVDLGPLQVDVKEKKRVDIPAPVGVVAVIGGVVLLVGGSRRAAARG